ncbi:glycosyltransferase [Winogradskyella flava]|uniref:Glycosyltransferase n=1 Tax=Winogradskyella flava TaxID=1884876 RepID=A0A842IP96_9FLAO|nr:glycosyltransferase [Winogradskyella flava]MBC2844485.1 glycosyltransferase [Winogradskyella flava]
MSIETALIVSPESWGVSKLSKHHYAIALAKAGIKVYFLTTESSAAKKEDTICEENKNIIITVVNIPAYLNILRFHNRRLYNYFLSFKVKKWVAEHDAIDWLFSFERSGVFTDLSSFKAKRTIFFPVDQVETKYVNEYKGFDRLVSISSVILDPFENIENRVLIHHGLSPIFISNNERQFEVNKIPKTIAYVGNLLIGPILDRESLSRIVNENPDITFHFYGPNTSNKNNLGANSEKTTVDFVAFLRYKHNCVLHGAVSSKDLFEAFKKVDGFLLCYDYRYDKNKCSNSHKIMEYLSTGKPIISTRISMYDDLDLFPMMDTFDNTSFPDFFKSQIHNWKNMTTKEIMKKRMEFAADNVYDRKIQKLLKL